MRASSVVYLSVVIALSLTQIACSSDTVESRSAASLLSIELIKPSHANADTVRSNSSETNPGPEQTGTLMHPELLEVSGMASSLRHKDIFWMINDSGSRAAMYAVNHKGESLGVWPLEVNTYDWEDMTSFEVDGESYLLVADIGDNKRIRTEYRAYIFTEPVIQDLEQVNYSDNPTLSPVRTIRFEYPDGSHNAEALSTDGEWIYIVTKASYSRPEHATSSLYRLPLRGGQGIQRAEFLGDMPTHTTPSSIAQCPAPRVPLKTPTALEINPETNIAYMLTYSNVIKIPKSENQDWADVILKGGRSIHYHELTQAEALTIGYDGRVWFTSENSDAPIWVLPANY